MTYVSAVALARAIGFERLSTVIQFCVRLGGAVDKATRLLKLPRDHLMGQHRIVLPKKGLQKNCGVVRPFLLIQLNLA